MAAAAVLRIGRWIKGDRRGVKGGNGAKGREALSNSISIGRHGGWPAVPTRFRTHSKFVYAPRDRMSRAEIVPSRDSVCQRASSSTRAIESRTNMSIGIERGNRCPRSWASRLFFIWSLGSWSNPKRCPIARSDWNSSTHSVIVLD